MGTTVYIFGSVIVVSIVSLAGAITMSLLKKERLSSALSFLIPLAVGALLGDAFFHLIPESFQETKNAPVVSFILFSGVISFFFLEKLLRWHHHSTETSEIAEVKNSPKHLGPLILVSDGFHNFIDGIIIGASYLVSTEVGIATTIAVILHEIPQEIGDFGVLIYAGYNRTTALLYNFLSALTAVAGAILAILLGSMSNQLMQGVIPFAAGVFIYIASSDLVPELHKTEGSKNLIPEIAGVGIGVLAMYLLLFIE